jgi:hypothetical protein
VTVPSKDHGHPLVVFAISCGNRHVLSLIRQCRHFDVIGGPFVPPGLDPAIVAAAEDTP